MTSLDTTSFSKLNHGGATTISSVHLDIMKTHILPRLDGSALLAAACTSSDLHVLSSDDKFWRDICSATWPSTNDPLLRHVISSFPSAHRSFFSDSFPHHLHRRLPAPSPAEASSKLISAVDVFCQDSLVFSKVHVSDTQTSWFACTPFRVDLVGHNESVPIPIRHGGLGDAWLRDLQDNLTVSWILIDPTRKRSASISGRSPVSVKCHWLSGDVQVRFGTILAAEKEEAVNCGIVVTCGGKEGGEMHVTEMSMQVENTDGIILNGKDSLVILEGALQSVRQKRNQGQNGKMAYEGFETMKTRRRQRRQKSERTLDLICVATGVTAFMTFWSFILFG